MDAEWERDARESYDRVAGPYAALMEESGLANPYMRATYATLADLCHAGDTPRRARAADIGCGPGLWTHYLASLDIDATGIDLSPTMIAHARQTAGAAHFQIGSILDIPIQDEAVDAVACMYVLHHLPDEALNKALDELTRVLRPGGVLLIGGHVGEGRRIKTEGYGGLPMHVHFIRRTAQSWEDRLLARGMEIEAHTVFDPRTDAPSNALFARKNAHPSG